MWVGLGIVALHDRDTRRAQADFRRALETATSGLDVLYNIVDMCRFHGFSSEAREYAPDLVAAATAAIAADPARPALYEYRALGYRALAEDRNAERDEAAARGLTGWWEGAQQSASSQAVPEVTLPPVNVGAR